MNYTTTKKLITFSILLLLTNASSIIFGTNDNQIKKIILKDENDDKYFLYIHNQSYTIINHSILVSTNSEKELVIEYQDVGYQPETIKSTKIYHAKINDILTDKISASITAELSPDKLSTLLSSNNKEKINWLKTTTQNMTFTGPLRETLRQMVSKNNSNTNILLIDQNNNLYDIEIPTKWSNYVYIGIPLALLTIIAAYFFVKLR